MQNFIQVYLSRKMLLVLFMGFASGLPLALTGSTLQGWMATAKVDLTTIGIFSLVALPYSLKFLWAPALDRFLPPIFAKMGRRKGWAILIQIALIASLVALSFCDPVTGTGIFALIAVIIAFFSASQDIVIDAFKTELLSPTEFGAGAATANLGYRVAMLLSGAGSLMMAYYLPWRMVYLIMAALMGIGVLTVLMAPEPAISARPKSLQEAVLEPFKEFFQRKGVLELLLFVVLYKLDVVFTLQLMTAFLLEQGFTTLDIGAVTKGFGLFAVLAGTFAGGAWMSRLGMEKSLWVFGILQGISGICFYILALVGHHYPMMVVTIAAENFFSGMGNAVYAAFIMSLCNPRFTATQFALLTSLMAITRSLAGVPSGWLAKTVGWPTYFLIAILLAVPSLLLLTRYRLWMQKKPS